MAALAPDQTPHREGVGGEWKCRITPCQKQLRAALWHTTCLYTLTLLKKSLLTIDPRKTKGSSVLVFPPPGWLILFLLRYYLVMLKAWQSFVVLWIKQLRSGGSEWVDLSGNWTWWAHSNKARAHGRTAANHNKLPQSSFCGRVMSLPLFMHAYRRQAKLLCKDDQSRGRVCWWEALWPHSTTAGLPQTTRRRSAVGAQQKKL